MPKMTKADGKTLVDTVILEKVWFDIPDEKIPNETQSCLVQPIVADYIERLENRIKDLEGK